MHVARPDPHFSIVWTRARAVIVQQRMPILTLTTAFNIDGDLNITACMAAAAASLRGRTGGSGRTQSSAETTVPIRLRAHSAQARAPPADPALGSAVAISSASLVLPIPGSPLIQTTRPFPRRA